MPEVAVFTEQLPMVGGDDAPGVLQQAVGAEFAEEVPELRVQAAQAIIVEIAQAAGDLIQLLLSLPPPIGPRRASRAARSTQSSRM